MMICGIFKASDWQDLPASNINSKVFQLPERREDYDSKRDTRIDKSIFSVKNTRPRVTGPTLASHLGGSSARVNVPRLILSLSMRLDPVGSASALSEVTKVRSCSSNSRPQLDPCVLPSSLTLSTSTNNWNISSCEVYVGISTGLFSNI